MGLLRCLDSLKIAKAEPLFQGRENRPCQFVAVLVKPEGSGLNGTMPAHFMPTELIRKLTRNVGLLAWMDRAMRSFRQASVVDIVGVTSSILVTPTIPIQKGLQSDLEAFWFLGTKFRSLS